VLDLVEALRASLQPQAALPKSSKRTTRPSPLALGERKPVKRASARSVGGIAPVRGRSQKR
jgi:hypothetical protein